jgi:hypothetical protein
MQVLVSNCCCCFVLLLLLVSTNDLTVIYSFYSPDDDSAADEFVFNVKTPVWKGKCMYCPDDDASLAGSLLATALVEDCAGLCEKKAAQELEVSFCNKILSSSSANLKSVNQCSIEFDIEPKNHIKKEVPVFDALATIDTTLILKGVAGDATDEEELALIAKAFVSAYNDIHFDSGYFMSDAEVPFSAATPVVKGKCQYCPDDDSFGGATTMVLDIVTPVVNGKCMYCPDDDASADLSSLKTNDATRKALEVAFCKKIQGSVSKKLSTTKSCSIAMESIMAVGGKTSL